jgi:glucose/arabinose dehydrogenase
MVAPLPAGPVNHHWTKNVLASPDDTRLYATVGSNSNVGERGLSEEHQRAAILTDASAGFVPTQQSCRERSKLRASRYSFCDQTSKIARP